MAAVTHDPEILTIPLDGAPVPRAPAPVPAEADPWAGPAHGPVVTVSGGRLGLRVLLGGLAALFLVNSLTALVDPSPFLSLVPGGTDQRWLGFVIAVNDAAVAAGLVASEWGRGRLRGVRAWQGAIVAWAGVWLLVAASLKGFAL